MLGLTWYPTPLAKVSMLTVGRSDPATPRTCRDLGTRALPLVGSHVRVGPYIPTVSSELLLGGGVQVQGPSLRPWPASDSVAHGLGFLELLGNMVA